MIKYIADPIYLPDNYAWGDLEDAKLSAKWRKVTTQEERMKKTDLTNKCGSCKHFIPKSVAWSSCYGGCDAGHPYGQRTRPACKNYERSEE